MRVILQKVIPVSFTFTVRTEESVSAILTAVILFHQEVKA